MNQVPLDDFDNFTSNAGSSFVLSLFVLQNSPVRKLLNFREFPVLQKVPSIKAVAPLPVT